eukprot:1162116-Pelagomonas_calceolata.AAC.5
MPLASFACMQGLRLGASKDSGTDLAGNDFGTETHRHERHRPGTGATGNLQVLHAPAMPALLTPALLCVAARIEVKGMGSRSFVVRAPEPPKTGPTTALPPRQPIWGASPMASRRASESQVSIASRASEKKSGEGSVVGGGSSNSSSKVSSTVMPVAAMPQRASETGDIMLNFPVPCPQALRVRGLLFV